jgi:hypothetical protein
VPEGTTNRCLWRLSDGRRVANEAAALAVLDPQIIAVDGTLSPDLKIPAQRYRFAGR